MLSLTIPVGVGGPRLAWVEVERMRAGVRASVRALFLFCLFFSLSFLSRMVSAAPLDIDDVGDQDPLAALRDDPIDLLADPLALLEEVPGAPPDFARRAEAARARRPFHRLEDLLVVPGVDGEFLARIGPLVRSPEPAARWRGRIVVRATAGSLAGGERASETFAFRRAQDLEVGGAVERDAGEPSWSDSRTLWLDARRGRAHLVLGDLDVDWGRGLGLSTASPPWGLEGRARRALGRGRGIAPHRGTGEERHLRGGAVSWRSGVIHLEALASSTRLDARVGRDGRVTSLAGTGLHRSAAERSTRDRLRERLAAVRGGVTLPGGAAIAALLRASAYDPALAPRTSTSLPTGSHDRIASIDLFLPLGPARIAGEAAARDGGGAARLLGVDAGSSRARVGLLARRLDATFRLLHAASPARLDRTSNEEGVLLWAEASRRGFRVSLARDRWREMAGRTPGAAAERGEELALSARLAREGTGVEARLSHRVQREGSGDADRRDAVLVTLDRPLGAGIAARLSASAIAQEGGPRGPEKGGAVRSVVTLTPGAGLRLAVSVTRYAGDSGAVLPRAAEAILPGVVRLASLGAGNDPSGWRTLVAARRSFGPAVRLATGIALHAPRGGPVRSDVSVSFELGRYGNARRTALTPPASDP